MDYKMVHELHMTARETRKLNELHSLVVLLEVRRSIDVDII